MTFLELDLTHLVTTACPLSISCACIKTVSSNHLKLNNEILETGEGSVNAEDSERHIDVMYSSSKLIFKPYKVS